MLTRIASWLEEDAVAVLEFDVLWHLREESYLIRPFLVSGATAVFTFNILMSWFQLYSVGAPLGSSVSPPVNRSARRLNPGSA